MHGEPIVVRHAAGEYPVEVGPGTLGKLGAILANRAAGRRIALLIDEAVVAPLDAWERGHGPWGADGGPLEAACRIPVPSGERHKTRETWAALTDALLAAGIGRDAVIVAVGGGVTGDLAGFVAATYLRGIPVMQVPTTPLAMLDAAIGGKTGVDTPHGKNLVGAFHQPLAIIADPATLATLPDRPFRAGLAEAVKHGLVADPSYFAFIEASTPALLARDVAALATLVRGSVRIKSAVTALDEREDGLRAILNCGHTVAHALEAASDYRLLHGEAVALGLVAESRIAETLGMDPGVTARVTALLTSLGLPVRLPDPLGAAAVRERMATDKKVRAGQLRFALPAALGRMVEGGDRWTVPVDDAAIELGLAAIGCVA